MNQQFQRISLLTDALERELLEQELRAMAQREAAEAFARGMRRLFAKVRGLFSGTTTSGLRSA